LIKAGLKTASTPLWNQLLPGPAAFRADRGCAPSPLCGRGNGYEVRVWARI